MILSRIRILPQERFDLEDLNGMLASARSDSKYNVQKLISNLNYVINGFTVTGVGLKYATVNMTEGTLIIPENTGDFSWFTTSPTDPNVIISDAELIDGTRNYIEIKVLTENNTPVTRAFWNPEANSGAGLEFNQIVDTMTDLKVEFVISTNGFSGSPDLLPLCIIDTDSSGTIKQIFDERKLFHRLATPFNWGPKNEPGITITISNISGVFEPGELVTIGADTAKVFTADSTSIVVISPSTKSFVSGDPILGLTSGASATVNTSFESFTGVDKNIKNLKEDLDAIKTEILNIKTNSATGLWWQDTKSITELVNEINQIVDILSTNSYDEDVTLSVDIPAGTTVTIPLNSRKSNEQQYYTVGSGSLEVYLNGQRLSQNNSDAWEEVGNSGDPSNQIMFTTPLQAGDVVTYRLGIGGLGPSGSGGGGSSAPDDDFITLPESVIADNQDFLLIRDVSANAYRKQRRSVFLAGLGGNFQVQTFTANHTVDINNDKVLLMNVGTSNKTFTLPDPTTCGGLVLYFKKIDAGLYSMIISGAGFMIDGNASISTNTQYESVTLVADAAGAQWVSL